jgi:hypothetical protein
VYFPQMKAGLAVAILALSATLAVAQRPVRVIVVDGSGPDGRATPQWLAMLHARLDPPEFDSVKVLRHARTPAEQAWKQLVVSRAAGWQSSIRTVAAAFDSIAIDSVVVVTGDRGAEDAFAHDSVTIGFDLAALSRAYGDAGAAVNPERLDRIFRHEFSHVLQKRIAAWRDFVAASPLDEAILHEWTEGLGNYFSLSADWLPTARGHTAAGQAALVELTPEFVSRMSALACARGAAADSLMKGLSSGPFAKKWGALPVALWLATEMRSNPMALRNFTRGGPSRVWSLADRNLPPDLALRLREARQRSASC